MSKSTNGYSTESNLAFAKAYAQAIERQVSKRKLVLATPEANSPGIVEVPSLKASAPILPSDNIQLPDQPSRFQTELLAYFRAADRRALGLNPITGKEIRPAGMYGEPPQDRLTR